jgi:hypothetical protein
VWGAITRCINLDDREGLIEMLESLLGSDGLTSLLAGFDLIRRERYTPCYLVCADFTGIKVAGFTALLRLPRSLESWFEEAHHTLRPKVAPRASDLCVPEQSF